MDHRMSSKECAILRSLREMHPNANGLIVFITKEDLNEVPCCFSGNPSASDNRIIAMGFEIGESDMEYVWETEYVPNGLFEWMGEYDEVKHRTSAFYHVPDTDDDLVTGLTFA